jgi:hypothetical protein
LVQERNKLDKSPVEPVKSAPAPQAFADHKTLFNNEHIVTFCARFPINRRGSNTTDFISGASYR